MNYNDHTLYVHTAYDWIDNGSGELMLVMDKTEGMSDDDNAKIIFDGSKEAILIRNNEQIVHLPIVVEQVCDYLKKLEKILITEMDGEDIDDVYEAQIEVLNKPLTIPKEVYVRLDKLK